MADLEDADDSVAFASGLGAIAVTLLSMVESGDTVIAGSELYGGTNADVAPVHAKAWHRNTVCRHG